MRIAIVAGELSGDALGGELIAALRQSVPGLEVEGIAGPALRAAGCRAMADIDDLSVMGLVEVLRHYPALKRLQQRVLRRYLDDPPDVFIGIDAPDFVLPIEHSLRQAGIPTVHYVSPTVWAWRRGRIRTVAEAADLLLTILPFEAAWYAGAPTTVEFVGHPLADQLSPGMAGPVISGRMALLPGSRHAEVAQLGRIFLETAALVRKLQGSLSVVCAAATPTLASEMESLRERFTPDLDVQYVIGAAREVLATSEVALVASGTATLEAMLVACPQVIAYRVNQFSYWILRMLVHTRFIGLPNLLHGDALVPEFIQHEVTSVALAAAVTGWLQQPQRVRDYQETCNRLGAELRQGASQRAANAVLKLVDG